jgi:deoxycytidylate deaminase
MKILTGKEKDEALKFIDAAAGASKKAVCLKRPRGVVLVLNGEIISEGANAPVDSHVCTECLRDKMKPKLFEVFNTEPCYSVHAEQHAILNAFKKGHSNLSCSKIYFTRLVDGGHSPVTSMSCSICSKLILGSGIESFVCIKDEGVCEFSAQEMNDLTFERLEKLVN